MGIFKKKNDYSEHWHDDSVFTEDEMSITHRDKMAIIRDNYCFYKLQHCKFNGTRRNAICIMLIDHDGLKSLEDLMVSNTIMELF